MSNPFINRAKNEHLLFEEDAYYLRKHIDDDGNDHGTADYIDGAVQTYDYPVPVRDMFRDVVNRRHKEVARKREQTTCAHPAASYVHGHIPNMVNGGVLIKGNVFTECGLCRKMLSYGRTL